MLDGFAQSGAKWLILSVPYQGTQGGLSLYVTGHVFRKRSFFKSFKFLKTFRIKDEEQMREHGFYGTGDCLGYAEFL